MKLSEAEKRKLREEYDGLGQLASEGLLNAWKAEKEHIISFCIDNGIHLYNIASIKLTTACKLLDRLIEIVSLSRHLEESQQLEQLKEQQLL
ncbi:MULTISPECIES: hypothetical protein [unclassified Legionella]|uniref:hypothetical protein n=1 Tax=unclassified Legionella TaxID=2622702 RepID=UPI0010542764|nr:MULTISPECIES: hypothetical protein [unclassified Legionella]MDI9818394.1 hypothetical protein [Legionella sp. PL877]